jgi:hypothetical protein
MLLFLLFFTITFAGYSPSIHLLPCPSIDDRKIAWYTGSYCYQAYSCCFDEQVEDSDGNFTAMSCCYTYGNNGPYKCCGRDRNGESSVIFLLFLLPAATFIFMILYYCWQLCCMIVPNYPLPKTRQNLESDTDFALEIVNLED